MPPLDKIFLSGDYELLCKMYGISGASGNAALNNPYIREALLPMVSHYLKEAPSMRTQQPQLRDLHTLATAHHRFTTVGKSDINVAKNYFNAIAKPFFGIPLDQVQTGCGIEWMVTSVYTG